MRTKTYPIVVFLQNSYFSPDTPTSDMLKFQHDHEYRREQLAKSMTGSRLKKALGDAFWSIWWDNANPERS